MEGLPKTESGGERLPELHAVFPDATLPILKDMLRSKSYLCFSVSAEGAVVVTGEDHQYLAGALNLDADSSLAQGVVALRDGVLTPVLYGDTLRATQVGEQDPRRQALETAIAAVIREQFGDVEG